MSPIFLAIIEKIFDFVKSEKSWSCVYCVVLRDFFNIIAEIYDISKSHVCPFLCPRFCFLPHTELASCLMLS